MSPICVFQVSMDREGARALPEQAWTSLDKQGVYPGTRAKRTDMDMDMRIQVMHRDHHGTCVQWTKDINKVCGYASQGAMDIGHEHGHEDQACGHMVQV